MSYQDQPCNIMGCLPMGASLDSDNLISFSIGETAYQAEPDMTFSQWVDSMYNTDGFTLGTNSVINSDRYVVLQSEEFARPSDAIENGYTYLIRNSYVTFDFGNRSGIELKVSNACDGTLEFSTDLITWSNATGVLMVTGTLGAIYFRGTNNTIISDSTTGKPFISQFGFPTSSYTLPIDLNISGSLETMLDYHSVLNGVHPTVGIAAFSAMIYGDYKLSGVIALNIDVSDLVLPFNTAYRSSSYMFGNSTTIVHPPKLPATTLAEQCYINLLRGCTSLISAPSLPATNLATSCYGNMFRDDTSLTSIPALPSTTLPTTCYAAMFRGCTSIKFSTTQAGEYQNEYRIPINGVGSGESDATTNMFYGTGGSFTENPTINTTYYTSNSIV